MTYIKQKFANFLGIDAKDFEKPVPQENAGTIDQRVSELETAMNRLLAGDTAK